MKTNDSRSAVGLKEAARALGVDVSTLRRDIAAGCPVVELGSVGRGKGSLVDVDEVRRWRAGQRGDLLVVLEDALMKVFRGDLDQRLKMAPGKVAYVLLKVYELVHEDMTQMPLVELPEQMRRLCAICLSWVENGHFQQED